MTAGYFKAKTHITLEKALEHLNISKTQFKSLLIHLNIRAECVSKSFRIGSENNSYKINDINKIFNSEVYKALLINNKIARKKDFYSKVNRSDLAKRKNEKILDHVGIIKKKYATFSDAVHDLGESLTFLYIFDFFFKPEDKHEESLSEIVKRELLLFEKMIIDKKMLYQTFPSRKGIHLVLKIDCAQILFFVPLQAEKDAIFDTKDELEHIKLYLCHLMMVKSRLAQKDNLTINTTNYSNYPENIHIEQSIYRKWLVILLEYVEIKNTSLSNVHIHDNTPDEPKEGLRYLHSAYIFSLFNQNGLDMATFEIGNFTEENFSLCYPKRDEHVFEKEFVDTLSKNKQRTIDDYIKEIKKETFFG